MSNIHAFIYISGTPVEVMIMRRLRKSSSHSSSMPKRLQCHTHHVVTVVNSLLKIPPKASFQNRLKL